MRRPAHSGPTVSLAPGKPCRNIQKWTRQNFCGWTLFDLRCGRRTLAHVQHLTGGSQGQRATACDDHRNPCHGKSYGARCSRSARFARSALRRTRKISTRANRPYSYLMIAARHAIAAPPVLPGAARVPRCISSCRSIIRAVRPRRRSSLPIWRQSTVRKPGGRGPPRLVLRGLSLEIRRPQPGLPVRDLPVRDRSAPTSAIRPIEFRRKSRRQARPPEGDRSLRDHSASVKEISLRSARPGSYRSSSAPRRCGLPVRRCRP